MNLTKEFWGNGLTFLGLVVFNPGAYGARFSALLNIKQGQCMKHTVSKDKKTQTPMAECKAETNFTKEN